MEPDPSALYTQCSALFRSLQAATGGDRGSRDVLGGGYSRHIMIYLAVHPSQGQSVMQEVRYPGPHNPQWPCYYTLAKLPGMKGHIDVPYTGEPRYYGGAGPADLQRFFVYWSQFAEDLKTFLQQHGL